MIPFSHRTNTSYWVYLCQPLSSAQPSPNTAHTNTNTNTHTPIHTHVECIGLYQNSYKLYGIQIALYLNRGGGMTEGLFVGSCAHTLGGRSHLQHLHCLAALFTLTSVQLSLSPLQPAYASTVFITFHESLGTPPLIRNQFHTQIESDRDRERAEIKTQRGQILLKWVFGEYV